MKTLAFYVGKIKIGILKSTPIIKLIFKKHDFLDKILTHTLKVKSGLGKANRRTKIIKTKLSETENRKTAGKN